MLKRANGHAHGLQAFPFPARVRDAEPCHNLSTRANGGLLAELQPDRANSKLHDAIDRFEIRLGELKNPLVPLHGPRQLADRKTYSRTGNVHNGHSARKYGVRKHAPSAAFHRLRRLNSRQAGGNERVGPGGLDSTGCGCDQPDDALRRPSRGTRARGLRRSCARRATGRFSAGACVYVSRSWRSWNASGPRRPLPVCRARRPRGRQQRRGARRPCGPRAVPEGVGTARVLPEG